MEDPTPRYALVPTTFIRTCLVVFAISQSNQTILSCFIWVRISQKWFFTFHQNQKCIIPLYVSAGRIFKIFCGIYIKFSWNRRHPSSTCLVLRFRGINRWHVYVLQLENWQTIYQIGTIIIVKRCSELKYSTASNISNKPRK